MLTKTARSCSRTAYVLNRGVARTKLFEKAGNYEAFERVLAETFQQAVMRISSYCVSRGMQDRPSGSGPTFFGGDKVGYLERDALRAGSVVRAEQWRWSSLLGRYRSSVDEEQLGVLACRDANRLDRAAAPTTTSSAQAAPTTRSSCKHCVVASSEGAHYGAPELQCLIARHFGLDLHTAHRARPRIARARNRFPRPCCVRQPSRLVNTVPDQFFPVLSCNFGVPEAPGHQPGQLKWRRFRPTGHQAMMRAALGLVGSGMGTGKFFGRKRAVKRASPPSLNRYAEVRLHPQKRGVRSWVTHAAAAGSLFAWRERRSLFRLSSLLQL